MLTYKLFKTQRMLLLATSKASQMVAYILVKTKSMLSSATSRGGQPDDDPHTVQNQKHALVSSKEERLARC